MPTGPAGFGRRRGSCPSWPFTSPLSINEAHERYLAGVDGPPVDLVPADVVHLGDGPGAVAVDRLDVGHVAIAALAGDHDRADPWRLALRVAVGAGVGPPVDRVAVPGHV